jgi:hypothetical protein
MGLLNFVKEAGEKIWDAVSGGSKEDKADKLKKHIDGLNLPVPKRSILMLRTTAPRRLPAMSVRKKIRKNSGGGR